MKQEQKEAKPEKFLTQVVLTKDLAMRLDATRAKANVSRSALIRVACERFLSAPQEAGAAGS